MTGELHSLARLRSTGDSKVPAEIRMEVTDGEAGDAFAVIPESWGGMVITSPSKLDEMARSLKRAAWDMRKRNRGACPVCQRLGCSAYHLGQVREWWNGDRYLVAKQTSKGWRMDPCRGTRGKPKYVKQGNSAYRLVGWATTSDP